MHMTEDIYIDVNYLTESERDIILQVLSKDEELRKQEKRRISTLKNELEALKAKGASEEEVSFARICARCREPLGLIFNSGSLCPKCQLRVCKRCRKVTSQSWLCVLCAKIRDVRAESGAWFHEFERKKGDRPQLYGSALVRASIRRTKPLPSQLKNVKNPGSPPAITVDLDNHGKLHRPVPVHLSHLVEDDREQEEKEGIAEINRNYKQYSKASPVSRKEEDEEQSDEQEKMSSASSRSSTPIGSPVGNQEAYSDEESAEDTVFDHLVPQISIEHEQKEVEEDEEKEEKEEGEYEEEVDVAQWTEHSAAGSRQEYHDNESEMNDRHTENSKHQGHKDHSGHLPTVEVTTNWHEVAHEWATRQTDSGQVEQDIHTRNDHLGPRAASPESQTTGEFFTPLTSPLHSGTGTPALSEHEQSEDLGSGSEYVDAGDATPVEENDTAMSLPEEDVHNVGDVTVTDVAEEATSSVSDDETQEGRTTPTADDDIDQAFLRYGKNNVGVVSGTKSLQDQLNLLTMGSRESIVSYYSDAGEGRFGNIPVTGEILFGLFYNKKKQELEVQVHRAKDIAPADEKKGKSDPYVKVYLLPDKTKGGKRKTKAKKNTLNPDFDEILEFKIGFDEMLTRTLWLAVWNHDIFGHNDFLGEVMLPLDTYQESGFSWSDPSPNWYPLRERRSEPSLMTYCGDMTVALKFQSSDESKKDKKKKKKLAGKLHVKLKEARNLPAKDSNGFSDPFCKSYLLPDTSKKTKQKTPIAKKNLNPVWNYSFIYDNLTKEELMDRVLELTVWDYDRGSSNDFLGGLRLGLGGMTESWDDSTGLEVDAWKAMLDWPNQWQEYTINLRSTMDSQVN